MKNKDKVIKTLILNKIKKINKLGIYNIDDYNINTICIKTELDALLFCDKYSIMLPNCNCPYVYIIDEKAGEIFFILTFLDSSRESFDTIIKNYSLVGTIFNKIKLKYVNIKKHK
jgi:hypothetical protein